ncbi:MAG TPA: hypothetical protein VK474_09515 [Chthoniobacterales bacterium]|nr:hypothetical protein [Chthoniobacterales bacterium]
MKFRHFGLVCALLFPTQLFAQDAKAQELAKEVWQASGGENWAQVKELRFTFIVEQDGKELVSAEHDWKMASGTDEVKWKGKKVAVNLSAPAQDEESKAAYARWTNDSYWLLAPLKLLDSGVKLAYEGGKESEGVACEVLRVSFEQVGLTPGDQYLLYIDPQTKLIRAWDYMPKADTVMHGTWEKYETVGGLKLATEHNFGGKMIRFEKIEALTK